MVEFFTTLELLGIKIFFIYVFLLYLPAGALLIVSYLSIILYDLMNGSDSIKVANKIGVIAVCIMGFPLSLMVFLFICIKKHIANRGKNESIH